MIHDYAVSTGTDLYKLSEPSLREAFDLSMAARFDQRAWFACQIVLLREILAVDDMRQRFTRYKKLIGRALSTLKEDDAPLDRVKRAQQLLDWADRRLMSCRWLLLRFRSIGDGLAWRLYDYDRGALRLMVEHEFVSAPRADIGLMSELTRLAARSTGSPSRSLLHSVTNFLRFGDITFREEGSDRLIIEEVKTSDGPSGRAERQAAHRQLMQQALDSGVAEVEGRKIRRIRSHRRFRTHARILSGAITDALQKYASSRVIEDYLSLVVLASSRMISEQPQSLWGTFSERHIARLTNVARRHDDVLLPPLNNLTALSTLSRIAAPAGIFPLPAEQRFMMLTGDVIVISVLNVSGLARWFRKRGWDASVVIPDAEADLTGLAYVPALQLWKKDKGVELPLDVLVLAAHELWTRESLEAIADTIREEVASAGRGRQGAGLIQVQLVNEGNSALD